MTVRNGARPQRVSDFSRTPALPSHEVLDVDVLPLERESVGETGGQRLHAEPLAGVVPGGDEVDPELARRRRVRLLGLAGWSGPS